MDIGIFQLLPRPTTRTDGEVVQQGLAEVDFAERHAFESVWIAEHHLSDFGIVGAPSVYAAAVAARRISSRREIRTPSWAGRETCTRIWPTTLPGSIHSGRLTVR